MTADLAPSITPLEVDDRRAEQPAVPVVLAAAEPSKSVWHRLMATTRKDIRAILADAQPRSKRPRKLHYPPRFSTEFSTSIVDRERRRL